jgi:hypothetical protein
MRWSCPLCACQEQVPTTRKRSHAAATKETDMTDDDDANDGGGEVTLALIALVAQEYVHMRHSVRGSTAQVDSVIPMSMYMSCYTCMMYSCTYILDTNLVALLQAVNTEHVLCPEHCLECVAHVHIQQHCAHVTCINLCESVAIHNNSTPCATVVHT